MEVLGNWAESTQLQSEGCWNSSGVRTCGTATLNSPADVCGGRQMKPPTSAGCARLGRVENVLEVTLLKFPIRSWHMGYRDCNK